MICALHGSYQNVQTEQNEMEQRCSWHGKMRNACNILVDKTEQKGLVRRFGQIKKKYYGDWIYLAQDKL